jgi:6-phosphofructokinase 1
MSDIYKIEKLGKANIASPINLGNEPGDLLADFVPDDFRVLADISYKKVKRYLDNGEEPPTFEVAGPRQYIYFEGAKLKVGIVTCGGICPGINNVIRGLTMTLYHGYGVRSIFGFRHGYAGLNPEYGYPVMELDPMVVRDIHNRGGTLLGTSRGPQEESVIVDTLERMNIGILFVVGGDGTFRGALDIHEEVKKRGLKIGIIGIPKTIDNDIMLVDHTFGFETAVSEAARAIQAAYVEASSVVHGIGLVKLMGRESGFIAASAALAVRNVNLVLIPELPFDLEGETGLFAYLEGRFRMNKSTVIVVAEGAGQCYMEQEGAQDASGNVKLGDIGLFLKDRITQYFKGKERFSLKYIDPSYIIRSKPADSSDSIFCGYLAQAAVHAGMSGRTGMAVGRSHRKFTHIPLVALTTQRKKVDPEGDLWLSVLESTGQPFYLTDEPPKQLSRASYYPCGDPITLLSGSPERSGKS